MTIRFHGEIERIYVNKWRCNIRLTNVTPKNAITPSPRYFYIDKREDEHKQNYDALFSLIMLASTGRHRITVRPADHAEENKDMKIQYLVLDW